MIYKYFYFHIKVETDTKEMFVPQGATKLEARDLTHHPQVAGFARALLRKRSHFRFLSLHFLAFYQTNEFNVRIKPLLLGKNN